MYEGELDKRDPFYVLGDGIQEDILGYFRRNMMDQDTVRTVGMYGVAHHNRVVC